MGITVKLETENGDEIQSADDPTNILHRVLPEPGDPQFQWANTIDWYGDTVFNHAQSTQLRDEWAVLIQRAPNEASRNLLVHIDAMLLRCASEEHVYVKFYGD